MPRIIIVNSPRDPIAAADTQVGSASTITWELARRLTRRHTTIVLAPGRLGELSQDVGPDSVRIHRTPLAFEAIHNVWDACSGAMGASVPHFASPSYFREYALAATHTLVREEPDIVIVQNCAQFLPVFRAALPGVQLNLHVHNETLAMLPPQRIAPQLRHADHIVTSSSWLTERLRSRVPSLEDRIHTVTGGADVRRFQSADSANEPQDADAHDEFRILYVGRISPEKGVHVLADAFNELADQNDRAVLEIAGADSLAPPSWLRLMREDDLLRPLHSFYGQSFAERLRQQVLHSGAAYRSAIERRLSAQARRRVRFLGRVPHQDLPALHRRAHVFVLPSLRHEPCPLPLAEAMASGLPSVVTRAGAIPEIVEAGVTALMVERGDAGALARALNALSVNPNMRHSMGCAARLRAERLFDWKLAVSRLESLYIRSLEPRAARRTRGVHSPVRQS